MDIIYNSSFLFNDLLNESNESTKIKTNFDLKFKDLEFTKEQIFNFITNYHKIDYTKDNIQNYANLISYFQYDIKDKFYGHIVSEYGLKDIDLYEFIDIDVKYKKELNVLNTKYDNLKSINKK